MVASCMLTGCSLAAAPAFELFGAYFPAWMLCALIGMVGAALSRVVLATPALSGMVPFQFMVCTGVGVSVGLLFWIALFS
jgi:YtcA family